MASSWSVYSLLMTLMLELKFFYSLAVFTLFTLPLKKPGSQQHITYLSYF